MNTALEKKERIVADVHAAAASAHSAVAAEYIGMKVDEMTELRRQAREAGVYLRVVKNTLARRALKETPCECLVEKLGGPLILAFSREEPTAAPRLLRDFARDAERPVVRMGMIDSHALSAEEVVELAELPTLDVALGRLAGTVQAPVVALVRTLREPYACLVRLLAAVGRQKEGT